MTTIASATPLLDRPLADSLAVQHLGDLGVELHPAQVIATPVGTRLTFVTKGGRIDGPRLHGDLLPGGGDWLLLGSDGIGRVDVRATIRTDDGVLIHFTARGIIKVPADGAERLARGERLPFEETYVRTTPTFDTADERYAWLTQIVAVAHNELSHDRVDYRMYEVL